MDRKYAFRKHYKGKRAVDPNDAQQEIEAIRDRNAAGVAPPAEIVAAATPEDAVLHPEFEWRDEVAAHKHRLRQATELSGAIVVVDAETGKPERTPVYTSVSVEGQQGVKPLEEVMTSLETRTQVVDRAMRQLRGWRRSYGHLAELSQIIEVIDVHLSE